MQSTTRIFLIVFFVSLIAAGQSFANLIDWDQRDRYLKQQEKQQQQQAGKEVQISPDLPRWMQIAPKVETEDEKKYDVNRDGVLSPTEMKVYLRRVYYEVQDGSGKSVSTSEALKEYDSNQDGVITKKEAERIRKEAF